MTDLATRVYDHAWKIDPIVRSLLDTDFYKLLMAQTVWRRHRDTQVRFSLINRKIDLPLAEFVDEDELRQQLDHIRKLTLRRGESTWLRGNTFYGKRWMFDPDFVTWFEDFQMPPYQLRRQGGQYERGQVHRRRQHEGIYFVEMCLEANLGVLPLIGRIVSEQATIRAQLRIELCGFVFPIGGQHLEPRSDKRIRSLSFQQNPLQSRVGTNRLGDHRIFEKRLP